jgi:hypothetical protein
MNTTARDPGTDRAAFTEPGFVTGRPRTWLRLEGLVAFVAAVLVYLQGGGHPLLLVPLLLVVDVSAAGYLAGPRVGAFTYNLAHTWAAGILVVGVGMLTGVAPLVLAGVVLAAHVGMDRFAGYGVKYSSAFSDTHLGRIGRAAR